MASSVRTLPILFLLAGPLCGCPESNSEPAQDVPAQDISAQDIPAPDVEDALRPWTDDAGADQSDAAALDVCNNVPTAIIKVAEGEEVCPGTLIHLNGEESYSPNGVIAKYEWSVDQPIWNQGMFIPSATFPNPTFEANVAGKYTFYLTVYDEAGIPSCFPAVYTVIVMCSEGIHVELTWHTPGDPNETDEGPDMGSDLNLHFTHPWAQGPDRDGDGKPDGWFHIPFDCFWFNPQPNWGIYDPAAQDDPALDRDDTDGAGPENINLVKPEDVTYRVGVHYWYDHGFGPAHATVRVYIYANLQFEVTDVELKNGDMWEVGSIEWPSGKITPAAGKDGEYKITPCYGNSYFGGDYGC
jgi:hypothetical protein